MKCCETEKGCGGCGGRSEQGCSGHSEEECSKKSEGAEGTTNVTMVANCTKGLLSMNDKKEDSLNDISELEIHYSVHLEEQSEFVRFEKLIGITNLQGRVSFDTNLDDCVYSSLEELTCDINDFLKANKSLISRLSINLDIYFIVQQ